MQVKIVETADLPQLRTIVTVMTSSTIMTAAIIVMKMGTAHQPAGIRAQSLVILVEFKATNLSITAFITNRTLATLRRPLPKAATPQMMSRIFLLMQSKTAQSLRSPLTIGVN
jgi:flagellar basal body-associated protein FliL